MKIVHWMKTHKWAMVIALTGVFLFYWFQIRPVRVYRSCVIQSSADARKLLMSKAELSKNTKDGAAYQQLLERNMYLHSDYKSFLQKCLLYYGLALPLDVQAPADAAKEGQPEKATK